MRCGGSPGGRPGQRLLPDRGCSSPRALCLSFFARSSKADHRIRGVELVAGCWPEARLAWITDVRSTIRPSDLARRTGGGHDDPLIGGTEGLGETGQCGLDDPRFEGNPCCLTVGIEFLCHRSAFRASVTLPGATIVRTMVRGSIALRRFLASSIAARDARLAALSASTPRLASWRRNARPP